MTSLSRTSRTSISFFDVAVLDRHLFQVFNERSADFSVLVRTPLDASAVASSVRSALRQIGADVDWPRRLKQEEAKSTKTKAKVGAHADAFC
jgi:hypothetical protein